MGAAPEFVVEASADLLAENTSGRLVATLVSALEVRPQAHVVITGGSILEHVLRTLRSSAGLDAVEWSRVHIWWGDERFVAADSADRNDRAAFSALLAAPALRAARVHRMPAAGQAYGNDVDAAAAGYARELVAAASHGDAVPDFDVILLGMGPDGHCASLFPEHPGTAVTGQSVVGIHNSPKPPPTRISLTFETLDAAQQVWFIASGTAKAQAVAMANSGAGRVQVPAAGPHGRVRTLWLLDHDGAAQLPSNLVVPPVA